MRASDDKSHGLISAALLAVVVSLVGLAGAVKIAQTAVALGPNVGDILRFDPQGRMPVDVSTQIDARQLNARNCMLDLDTIHRTGGSLIVEQRLPGPADSLRYRVHWAGPRTAVGSGNCGRQAELLLNDSNLDLLAMAAGGWGVDHRQFAPTGVWGSDQAGTRIR